MAGDSVAPTALIATRNLGRILRKLFGIGKPRCLQGGSALAHSARHLGLLFAALAATLRKRRRLADRLDPFHFAATARS